MPTASGLLAAAVQGRQVDAIRVALEYAQSAAAGKEIKEPPVADAEDFAAHLQDQGRRKSLRKARKRRQSSQRAIIACDSPAQRPARLSELEVPGMDCEICHGTRWKSVTVDGVERLTRCDCWRARRGPEDTWPMPASRRSSRGPS